MVMSAILNKEELLESNSELRGKALEILEAGYEAIDTEKILRKKIRIKNENLIIRNGTVTESTVVPLPLTRGGARGEIGRVFFIGIGKCALDGARVIEDILGDYLTDGIALDVETGDLKKIKSLAGTHPYPSEQNISATKEILKMVENLDQKDLVICLISGGGSSLFELPVDMSRTGLDTLIKKTEELTARGADIYELNTVRKNLSQVKGGKFARLCYPAQIVSLIFSDVLGNDISVVASGPTVAKLSSPSQGEELGDEVRVKNILIASNHDALITMKNKAEELGFNATIETEKLSGNARKVGKELALREPKPKTCILFGGETTVKITENHGIGGRNQELALSALLNIPGGALLISAASDGWDNTDHAGAIADQELFEKAKTLGLSPEKYLEGSDSYNFFKRVGGAICTGKLGSNVSDLYIMLYK